MHNKKKNKYQQSPKGAVDELIGGRGWQRREKKKKKKREGWGKEREVKVNKEKEKCDKMRTRQESPPKFLNRCAQFADYPEHINSSLTGKILPCHSPFRQRPNSQSDGNGPLQVLW